MKKNTYISVVLLFVFSFVLMHNVIPHHHHDEISEINNHQHNHHHHHDNKEKDHHNEKDEPIGLFSHSAHFLASTEFIFSSYEGFEKTQNDNQYFLNTDFVIISTIITIKRKPPNYISVIPLRVSYTANSLRGPPVFSV